jgi:4-oxalocrotonate tautomerase
MRRQGIDMPIISVKVIEGVFGANQKRAIGEMPTAAMVSIEGENMRPVTLCYVREMRSGDYGLGGRALTAAEVKNLAAGQPAAV